MVLSSLLSFPGGVGLRLGSAVSKKSGREAMLAGERIFSGLASATEQGDEEGEGVLAGMLRKEGFVMDWMALFHQSSSTNRLIMR
jgi:hypothetical protein